MNIVSIGKGALRRLAAVAALSAAAATGAAGADTPALFDQAMVPLKTARQAALAAVHKCEADGYRVSASVVNPSGVLIVLMRADGAGPHTVESSRRKAYTAASLGRPTGDLAALIAGHPSLQALRDMNDSMLMLGGGFPIRIGGKVLGGLGVGGSPGANFDEGCARAGLKSIGADTYEPQK